MRHLARDAELFVVGFRDPGLEAEEAFLDFVPRERCFLLPETERISIRDFLELRFLPRWCLSYFSRELFEIIDGLINSNDFDTIHISHSYMAYYMLRYAATIPCVIDHHNVKSLFFRNAQETATNWFKKTRYRAEQIRWQHYEREIIPLFPRHFACSKAEVELIRDITGGDVRLLPSGVDRNGFVKKQEPIIGNNLLFTGSLDYFPNAQAIEFFCDASLPRIRRAVPDVRVQVVGKDPTRALERLLERTESVWYSYNVRDIRPFYYQSTVFIVPLLTGAGTRLKIMEAMAVGLPVVSTSKGCEGLGLKSGEGIVIENDPGAFADAVIRLLTEHDYRQEMSRIAHDVCKERFDWENVLTKAMTA